MCRQHSLPHYPHGEATGVGGWGRERGHSPLACSRPGWAPSPAPSSPPQDPRMGGGAALSLHSKAAQLQWGRGRLIDGGPFLLLTQLPPMAFASPACQRGPALPCPIASLKGWGGPGVGRQGGRQARGGKGRGAGGGAGGGIGPSAREAQAVCTPYIFAGTGGGGCGETPDSLPLSALGNWSGPTQVLGGRSSPGRRSARLCPRSPPPAALLEIWDRSGMKQGNVRRERREQGGALAKGVEPAPPATRRAAAPPAGMPVGLWEARAQQVPPGHGTVAAPGRTGRRARAGGAALAEPRPAGAESDAACASPPGLPPPSCSARPASSRRQRAGEASSHTRAGKGLAPLGPLALQLLGKRLWAATSPFRHARPLETAASATGPLCAPSCPPGPARPGKSERRGSRGFRAQALGPSLRAAPWRAHSPPTKTWPGGPSADPLSPSLQAPPLPSPPCPRRQALGSLWLDPSQSAGPGSERWERQADLRPPSLRG